jgi:Tol biopolymer transport system component
VNTTTERHNFDIWSINVDGTNPTQLTVNGSYDADPAVSPDGKSVFFISNRGVQEDMQDNLQIWRLDLISSHAQASLR